jgi:transcriptional regulator with XRE-family HTH domain
VAKKFNEAYLKPGQRQAAELLLTREFAPKKERLTDEQIAEAVGVTRMTIYRWRTQDENFIAYYTHQVDLYMRGQFGFVMKKMYDGINAGSMKGIELYLKMAGMLIDKQQLEIDDKSEDAQEKQQRLRERLDELERKAAELPKDNGNNE